MRKPILIIPLLLLSLGTFGQVERPRNLTAFDLKRIHFGFTVGVNAMDVGFIRNYDYTSEIAGQEFRYADLSHPLPGFQVSIVSDLRLNENWNLRFLPGISFGSREIYFYEYNNGVAGDLVELPNVDNPVPLGPAFLDFPLQFKYRSLRVNNYRPYLVGGLNFRYDMSAKKPGSYDSESNEYMKFKRGDLYLEFGFGVDNYLRYFKFAPEVKLAVGLMNIIDPIGRTGHPDFAGSIESARSYIIMFNFHFE
ncbi:MAG: PorT family protein [Bacteroidales bacterium]|nr:PorT family protein [Bacteroidales bacterium]